MARPPRVLHIEDDPQNRLLVRKLLGSAGWQVEDATDGREGVAKALADDWSLVLVDIDLPQLDGYEVTLKLRGIAHLARVPIVAITAHGDRRTSLAVGCDGFIGKPIDVKTFVKTVTRYVEGRRDRPARGEDTDARLRAQSRKIVGHLEDKIAELERANEKLRELDRLRKQFYQNISHELSTPMTPVVGYVRLLLDEELGPVTPLQRKVLESIASCTDRLRGLIENLLDLTAIETGRMHFYDREYDFAAVARTALEMRERHFVEKPIDLEVVVPARTLAARGDPDKVSRAMVAVLENAAKFTPAGGRVRVEVSAQDQTLKFEVVDSGEGIPPEIGDRIFDPFFQADGSSTRKHPGVGLGLALARRVLDAMGGRIWAESPPVAGRLAGSGGTRVVFELPRTARPWTDAMGPRD